MRSEVKVWDIWVRLFHWLLVGLILFSWLSAELGGNWMIWHTQAGFITAGLIIFRLIWGFWGSWSARFSAFVKTPKQVLRYIKGEDSNEYLSHNPLGALGVIGLIALVSAQVLTGLFSNDDIFIEGPLASLVSYDTSLAITEIHETLFNLLVAAVCVHLAGVLFHQKFKKEPLIQAMLHGRKPKPVDMQAQTPELKTPTLALLIALAAGIGLSLWLFSI